MTQTFDASKGRTIQSRACGFMYGGIVPIVINNRFERAQRALLAQAEDDYVADVKLSESWTFAFIGTVHCTYLEATAFPRL